MASAREQARERTREVSRTRPGSRIGFACLRWSVALLLGTALCAEAEPAVSNDAALLQAMETEITRAFEAFAARTPPLYYLACGVTEIESLSVGAGFGALTQDYDDRRRVLDEDARCGSYSRDQTHPLPGHGWSARGTQAEIPLDDDPTAIRMALWRAFETEYRQASELLTQVQALDITKAALRDRSDDFSRTEPERHVSPPAALTADREAWRAKVRRYTQAVRTYPHVYQASAAFQAIATTRVFVSSEGARLRFGRVGYALYLNVMTRAEDGLDVPLHETFFAWSPEALPSDEQVVGCMTNLAATAERLRLAPLVEPYSGPALLAGEAAAVFLHEVLGHRLEGHRQKDEKQSQTFKALVGQPVMPAFLSVLSDPTLRDYRELPLSGAYAFDEEGVRARRVVNVEGGVLKEFLKSRMPIDGFPRSNGHGRAQPGRTAVSRQSNLILETTQPQPVAALRDRLKDECRRLQKPYGLMFAKVEGGFTMTGRITPNAFNVRPLLVYRIYTDERPDELVRGVDIIGTPLTVLSRILAAGDDVHVFNGVCGAESGGVPVAAVAPTVLLGEIEVQKKEISRSSAPVLPSPVGL